MKEIKSVYKALALKYHPDKQKDPAKKKEMADMFMEIQHAYDTLSKLKKKRTNSSEHWNMSTGNAGKGCYVMSSIGKLLWGTYGYYAAFRNINVFLFVVYVVTYIMSHCWWSEMSLAPADSNISTRCGCG